MIRSRLPLILAVAVLTVLVAAVPTLAGKLYWTDPGMGIHRANLDGSEIELLVIADDARGIAVDVAGQKMYWLEPFELRRANLDGTQVETLVEFSSTSRPWRAIALDTSRGFAYVTREGSLPAPCGPVICSGSSGQVWRARLDGTDLEHLWSGHGCPVGFPDPCPLIDGGWIDVDEVDERIYLADWLLRVGTIVVDSSGDIVIEFGELQPTGGDFYTSRGIAVDRARERLIVSSGIGEIEAAPFDGSDVVPLAVGVDRPEGVALDLAAGKIYWASSNAGTIQRANLDGSQVESVLTGLPEPYALAIDPGQDVDDEDEDEDGDEDEDHDWRVDEIDGIDRGHSGATRVLQPGDTADDPGSDFEPLDRRRSRGSAARKR